MSHDNRARMKQLRAIIDGRCAARAASSTMRFSDAVREARVSARITQVELAAMLGVGKGVIERIESGKGGGVAHSTVAMIAISLGISPKSLLKP